MTRPVLIAVSQVRASLLTALHYRWDFLTEAVLALGPVVATLVPFEIAFSHSSVIAGWDREEALVVLALFITFDAIGDSLLIPSLASLSGQIRSGTLDFLLLKPAPGPLLLMTQRFELWKLSRLAVVPWVAHEVLTSGKVTVSWFGCVAATAIFAAALVTYACLWFFVMLSAFWALRVGSLPTAVGRVFEAAQWPRTVYSRVSNGLGLVVLPVTVMTSAPAEVLLRREGALRTAALLVVLMCLAATAAVLGWRTAIRGYTSAGS